MILLTKITVCARTHAQNRGKVCKKYLLCAHTAEQNINT